MSSIDAAAYPSRSKATYGYAIDPSGIPQDAISRALMQFRSTYNTDPTLVVLDKSRYKSLVDSNGLVPGIARSDETPSGLKFEFKVFNTPVVTGWDLTRDTFVLMREFDYTSMQRANHTGPDKAVTVSASLGEQAVMDVARSSLREALAKAEDAAIISGPVGVLNQPGITVGVNGPTGATNTANPVTPNPPAAKVVKEASLIVMKDAMAVLKQTLDDESLDPIERSVLMGLLDRWQDETNKRGMIAADDDVHNTVLPGDRPGVDAALKRVKKKKHPLGEQTMLQGQAVVVQATDPNGNAVQSAISQQIAEALGVPPDMVQSHARQAGKQSRKWLV